MYIVAGYFGIGALFLAIFDLVTGRIRRKFDWATTETQLSMTNAMVTLSRRAAKMLFLICLWVLWPAVVYGALTSKKGGANESS